MIKKIRNRWRIDYRDKSGHRHEKTFDTRTEADAALAATKTAINAGTYISPKAALLFNETAETWLQGKSDRRPGTVSFWCNHIDRFLNPKFGTLRLDQITVEAIESARNEWRKSYSPRTINALLTTMSAIFKLAVRHNRARFNPAASAERTFVGSKELSGNETKDDRGSGIREVGADEVLTPAEIRKMLDASKPGFDRTMLMTAALTWMRSGELFALQWSDIEFGTGDRGKLFVRRTLRIFLRIAARGPSN